MEKILEIRVSVCLAAYNGSEFISDQVLSILTQLSPVDELIVCDDCSTDDTLLKLEAFASDVRLRVISNHLRVGYVKNFERALTFARGFFIMLSDQDDLWESTKIEQMLGAWRPKYIIISEFHRFYGSTSTRELNTQSCEILNKSNLSILSRKQSLADLFLGRSFFYGSTFLFARDQAFQIAAPFPNFIRSHDIWIAMCYILKGGVIRLNIPLTYRRVHSGNQTVSNRRFYRKVLSRIWFARAAFVVLLRCLILDTMRDRHPI